MALFRCGSCLVVYEDYYPLDDTCIHCKQGLIRIVTTNQHPKETTMEAITPTLQLFTTEEPNSGTTFSSIILKYKGNNYHLHASTKDTIYVFAASIALYVLTINKINDTIGLNAYMAPEPFPINSTYLHDKRQIDLALGHDWNAMSPLTIVEKLMDLLF